MVQELMLIISISPVASDAATILWSGRLYFLCACLDTEYRIETDNHLRPCLDT